MFPSFFLSLHKAGIPVSLREYLTLLGGMKAHLADYELETFYYLARTCLVKDERYFDRYDRVFAATFQGAEAQEIGYDVLLASIPEEWLRSFAEKILTPEEIEAATSQGGMEKLIELLAERLREQDERHSGGKKWVGPDGTSPFGNSGIHENGMKVGDAESRERTGGKVWNRREFRNLDGDVELGTRNLKVALRRLRRFAREGAPTELDLSGTITATARHAGLLDLQMRPERHNNVKVLMLLDIGGSMTDHVKLCAELFSAARTEFKHLAYYYFHNCPYETLWRDNRRWRDSSEETWRVLQTYPPDWKLVFVGDALMAPQEITTPGASVEHWNQEPGALWIQRLLTHFRKSAWLNPLPEAEWRQGPSIGLIQRLMAGRMYAATPTGIDAAARELSR